MVLDDGTPMPIDTVDLQWPDAAKRLEVALALTGFVQLIGHGLSESSRRDFRAVSAVFFDLDHDTKSRFVHPDPAANRGYRARGSEALSYSLGEPSPPDLFESFNTAPTAPAGVHHRLRQSTPWPNEVTPGFSSAATGCFHEFGKLARQLDGLIGEILGLPWLGERSTSGPDMLASINYRPDPSGAEQLLDGQLRMGAHSDYTTFTLLDADPVRGLQIVGPEGEWVDVIPEPGALLMNVGDVLAMLTNDSWPSTLHRVVPMEAGGAPFRRSVAYFHYPDLDVEIAPLDLFVSESMPARYAPVTVEDHLLGKLVAPKTQQVATAVSTAAGRKTS